MKMIKAFALMATLASASSFASLYVGVNGGLNSWSLQKDSSLAIIPPPPVLNRLAAGMNLPGHQLSNSSAVFNFLVGYDFSLTNVHIAAEFNVGQGLNSKTSTELASGNPLSLKENLGTNLTFLVKPGFEIASFQPHVNLGYVLSSFKTNSTDGGDLGITGNQSKWLDGFLVGAGLDYSVLAGLHLTLDYHYIKYGAKTLTGAYAPSQGGVVTTKYSNSVNQILLGASYHFPI